MATLKWKLTFIIFTFLATSTLAKAYQSAEGSVINQWEALQNTSTANDYIQNIYDKDKRVHVTQFQGEGTKSTYLLKLKQPYDEAHKILSWDMKFNEDFVIFIELFTNKGTKRLIYTPGNENSHLQYGLNHSSILEEWKTYTRDLKEDLNYFMPNSKILSINSFVIKGNGQISNVKFIQKKSIIIEPQIIQDAPTNENNQHHYNEPKKNKKKIYNLPQIEIYGDNPLFLKIGQTYVEKGVKGIDVDGSELPVDSSHHINIYKAGEYSIMYIAKNQEGDSVVQQRLVIIGNATTTTQKSKGCDSASSLALESCQSELLEWKEKVLAMESLALAETINNDNNINQNNLENLPPRPGL